MPDHSINHPLRQSDQLANKMLRSWWRLLAPLLVVVLGVTLLGPAPVHAVSPGCSIEPGWWESKGLNPVFPSGAAANETDCDFQRWSWTAFAHYMQKNGPTGQPLFLSLPTAQDLEQRASGQSQDSVAATPGGLRLAPRFQKPGLASRRRNQDDLSSLNQAGSEGILVDQDSRVVYYSIHVNRDYYNFAKLHMGNENYNKTPPIKNFPVNATVVKAAWKVVDENSNLPRDTFTTKATIQLLETDKDGKLQASQQTQPNVTVALVGVHVVGVVDNHPEFIWATFEQNNNTPDLAGGTSISSDQQVSAQNFTFYKAGTTAANSNKLPAAYTLNAETQQVKPLTNIFRQFAHGGAEFSAESPTVSGMNRVADIDSINANFRTDIPVHPTQIDPVFSNYKLIGSVWLDTTQTPLKPGLDVFGNAVGSITLANSTMESFVQGIGANCFSCHTTQPFPTKSEFKDKNIAVSHIISGSLTPTTSSNQR